MHLASYLRMLRPVDGLMAALAVLIGFFVAAAGIPFWSPLLLALISVFLFSGAGIALNDFFDFEMDRVNAPQRPLPSGKIGRKSALYYSALLFAAAIVLASLINIFCFGLALLNTALEILYAWKLKRVALLGNFTDSWFPASSFLYGALAFGSLGAVPVLALLAFLANTGREIYGDLEDIRGDRKQKARTLPIWIGEKAARAAANAFILAAVALSVLPWYIGILGVNYLFIVAVADLVFVVSMFSKPEKNQALTKIAMLIAMLAFAAGVL